MADWKPKIERRQHPFGEAGVNSSLQEVAKKAAEGSLDPRVRAWAIECLERARREKSLKVNTEKERAEILLKAVQAKLWVPDPVGSEWMAGAHLMACVDKDSPCFHGGDCDDLAAVLGACFLTVGLHTMIVGHGYNAQKQIAHVLCAVRVAGRWLYADPSTDLPLGECVKFTREQLLSTPNVKVLCDRDKCLTFPTLFDPNKNGFVDKGEFVGVNGPDGEPILQWIEGPGEVMRWLGEVNDPYSSAYDALKDNWSSSGGDTSTFSREAMRDYWSAACGSICGDVGAWAGEKFGEFLEALGGRSNPCQDNPKSCVATNEASTVLSAMGMKLASDWGAARNKIAELLPTSIGPDIERAQQLLAQGPHISLVGPEWPYSGQTSTTLENLPSLMNKAVTLAAEMELEMMAAVVAAGIIKSGMPPKLRSASQQQWPSTQPQPVATKKSSGVGKILVGTAVIGALGYAAFSVLS